MSPQIRPSAKVKPAWTLLTAGADAVILLFLFFLISSNFVAQPGLAVALPFSPLKAGPMPDAEILTIGAGAPPAFYFREERIPSEALASRLAVVAPDTPLIVRADAGVPYNVVVEAVSTAMEQGLAVVLAAAPAQASQPLLPPDEEFLEP